MESEFDEPNRLMEKFDILQPLLFLISSIANKS